MNQAPKEPISHFDRFRRKEEHSMNETIESILKEYDGLVQQRKALIEMIRRIQSVTEEDIIKVISYNRHIPHVEETQRRVTGSPEKYATNLRDVFLKKYQEELDYCMTEYHAIDIKISLIESAVAALPEKYSRLIEAMYFRHLKWDTIEGELNISRKSISNQRRKALELLKQIWNRYSFLLSMDEEMASAPAES